MTATRHEQQRQRMRERHEDIEDLLHHGATIAEIIDRSGYAGWPSIHASLKNAGREDLLGALKLKLRDSDLPQQWRTPALMEVTCSSELCANRPFQAGLCLFHEGAQYRWCIEPGCDKPRTKRRKCETHYRQERKSQL